MYDFKNGDVDLLIVTKDALNDEIVPKSYGLLLIDEKSEFVPKDIKFAFAISNANPDILCLSSLPLIDGMAKLLYPDCQYTRIPYSDAIKCKTSVCQKIVSNEAFSKVGNFVAEGGQALIVNSIADVEISKKYFLAVCKQNFPNFTCEQINSETNHKDTIKLLNDFKNGDIDILVCSNIKDYFVEPKAKLAIIIDDADRIGLSQIHRIRNIALKSGQDNLLFLICFAKRKQAIERLEQVKDCYDGQSLVSYDLQIKKDVTNIGLDD